MPKIWELLPYLRLLEEGQLQKNTGNQETAQKLLQWRWATLGKRSNFLELTELGRQSISKFLDGQWPQWRGYVAALKEAGQGLTLEGIKEYETSQRRLMVDFQPLLHKKTLAAILGMHSKSGLPQRIRAQLEESTTVTSDQALRFRANPGLKLKMENSEVPCDPLMSILGEIIVPERAFIGGLSLGGQIPDIVLTVENLGSYIDLPQPGPKVLVLHVPGKDTPLAIRFMDFLPETVRHFHFGDLDPAGLEIAEFLDRNTRQPSELFLPTFWEEYASDAFAFQTRWPDGTMYGDRYPLVLKLKREGLWMEQERITLDPRLAQALLNL